MKSAQAHPGSMRGLFRQESTKAIAAMAAVLDNHEATTWDVDTLLAGCRRIRNGARISGSNAVDELTSEVESVLLKLQAGDVAAGRKLHDTLKRALRELTELVEESRREPDPALRRSLGLLLAGDHEQAKAPPTRPAPPPAIGVGDQETKAPSMQALLRQEVQGQVAVLTRHLLAVEAARATVQDLEALMRAAHSIKGAARITGVNDLMALAHAMEDLFVATQQRRIQLGPAEVDLLLRAVDGLGAGANQPGSVDLSALTDAIGALLPDPDDAPTDADTPPNGPPSHGAGTATAPLAPARPRAAAAAIISEPDDDDDGIRISPQGLDQMLGLSGELGIATHRLEALRQELLRVYREGRTLARELEDLIERIGTSDPKLRAFAQGLPGRALKLSERQSRIMSELEGYEYTTGELTRRLHATVVAQRMCAFGESATAFQRLVRDLCRALGKQADLSIRGEATRVDRDILNRLRIPLTHLLQNAVDHGLEDPPGRSVAGKSARGAVLLEARHRAGRLIVVVQDDGRGIDREQLRRRVAERGLADERMLASMTDTELFDFLLLPGFTLKGDVSTVSGRGVGLDLVRGMVQSVHGTIHIDSRPGQGTRFELRLPLTLSLIRCLLVEIGAEVYALPIARIGRVLRMAPACIRTMGGKDFVDVDGQPVGLVDAGRLLGIGTPGPGDGQLNLVLMPGVTRFTAADTSDPAADTDRQRDGTTPIYGLVVERLLGETELVERPLDPRLGKVRDVAAAAMIGDGRLALILDLDDLAHDIDRQVASAGLGHVARAQTATRVQTQKRVLVVDDSLTVREIERGLLAAKGYEVEVAVDGIDGWNAVRLGGFDLVVTDVDMPRMDGIALVENIRRDPRLRDLPVMIVSYKDRDADRRRGLEAGADCYLTKGAFHDDDLTNTVAQLIGDAK